MAIDWGIAKFKTKIIDNARYIFDHYIDTSKGLDALYSRPEISSEKAKCYKNLNLIRLTGDTKGEHLTAWKIDDASNINKMYVRGKVNVISEWNGSISITDSTLKNQILFMIVPGKENSDFRVDFRINDSQSTIYKELVDLSYGQFYDLEGMIDFRNNTISVARDNVEKPVVISETFPSFDIIHVGLTTHDKGGIPDMLGKDIFITWE